MKKIILFLTIAAALFVGAPQSVDAQVSFKQTAYNATGTITNTGIDTMTYTLAKGYPRILVGMTYTRASGTAAGTAILEYKIGTTDNWVADAGDTLTVTNVASRTYYWNKTNPARFWRLRVGGATTVTASVAAKLEPAY